MELRQITEQNPWWEDKERINEDEKVRGAVSKRQKIEFALKTRIAKESAESEDVKLLMGIPGVNYYTALLLTSEIGDFSRFSSANKLVSWLGLAPRVHQSANTIYNGRITKEGSPRVRWALVQAARSAVRWLLLLISPFLLALDVLMALLTRNVEALISGLSGLLGLLGLLAGMFFPSVFSWWVKQRLTRKIE
ncbi:Transposase [Methanophagales archaeon]|nr:Transposase [Methanophagales archaeon]